MNKEKMIDIIIPAYHAHDTIIKTICSIVEQTISDKVRITIINDGDSTYSSIVDNFSNIIDIREIILEENRGPGVARQFGIDNTSLPYFTCIDADDTFAGAYSLEVLLKYAKENPNACAVIGSFAEEHKDLNFITHTNDLVWMFGKLYRRSFIEKYDIKFNETRSNEDTGFNTILRLCADDKEPILFINDMIYYWHSKEDSITRINNCEYSYNQSFVGFTDNMIYAIKEAKKKKPFNGSIDKWAVETMVNLYTYYLQTIKRDNRFIDQNFDYCRKYYMEVYKEIHDRLDIKIIDEIYARIYHSKASDMMDISPRFTYYQFLEMLEYGGPKTEAYYTKKDILL